MVEQFIVDTSVWINFLNGKPSTQVDYLSRAIAEDRDVFLTPTIVQEILQGIRSDQHFKQVEESLLAFTVLNWNPTIAAIEAAKLYRDLRKKGLTIRKSNDCLIATFAIHFDLPVLHQGRDFQVMSLHDFIKTIDFS